VSSYLNDIQAGQVCGRMLYEDTSLHVFFHQFMMIFNNIQDSLAMSKVFGHTRQKHKPIRLSQHVVTAHDISNNPSLASKAPNAVATGAMFDLYASQYFIL